MDNYKPRLEKLYNEKLRSSLKEQFKYKNDLVMVAMNNIEKKMRIDPQRFYEVIKDRKSGKDIFNDKIYKLSKKVTIPAKTVTVLEIY